MTITPVLRLAVARGASILGREAAAIAVLSEVYGRTHSAAWVAGTLLACEGVYALASVPAGALADRLDRRRLMLVSDLAGVGLALLVATLPATPLLILLAGVAMIVEAPFVAASRAVLPSLVEADELARASALTVGARTVGYALGPLVGGAGAALVGAREVLLLNAASFLVSACLVVGLPRGGSGAPARRRAPGRMRDGFQALLSSPALRGVTGGWMLGRIAFGFAATAQVALAASLGAGPTGLGVLVTALGLGSLGGAPLAGRLVGSRGQAAVAIGLCLIAGGFAVTVCATTLLMAAIGLVLAGAGDAVSTVGEEVVLLGSTDEGLRGRTVAAYETLLVGSGLAAYPLAALIASSGAGRVGFGVATGLALGAAAVARRGGPPSDASQRTSTVTTSIALLP